MSPSKQVVLYSDPFIPREWIAAHGVTARRVMPSAADAIGKIGQLPGLCPYARAYACAAASDDASPSLAIFTTSCDQMRRISELASFPAAVEAYVFSLPHTLGAGAMDLYVDELRRLGRRLVAMGGVEPDSDVLMAELDSANRSRAGLLAFRATMGARDWAELAASYHASGVLPERCEGRTVGAQGVPIGLIGGPMLSDNLAIFDAIESAGAAVVLDGTETGERTIAGPTDLDLARSNPLQALALAYFGVIPDPFRRPNQIFYSWLANVVAERGLRGIVLFRHLWCDRWHAEVHRIRAELSVPLLDLDTADGGPEDARVRTRIEAFVETLT